MPFNPLKFLTDNSEESYFYVLKLDPLYAGVGVFEIDNNSKITLISYDQEPLNQGAFRSGHIVDFDSCVSSLKLALKKVNQKSEINCNNLIVSYGGDLSFNCLTTVKITRDQDVPLSEKELKGYFKDIYNASQEQVQKELFDRTGDTNEQLESSTVNTIYIKADGSVSENPINSECSELEVAVYLGYTKEYFVKELKDLAKGLSLKLQICGPLLHGLTTSLKPKMGTYFDGTLINVEYDYTEVGVVFGGVVTRSKVLPLGSYHIYKSGAELWTSGLEILFSEFSGVKTFSHDIYLFGSVFEDVDILSLVTESGWTKTIPFKTLPKFTKVSAHEFIGFEQSLGASTSLLGSAALYLDLEKENYE